MPVLRYDPRVQPRPPDEFFMLGGAEIVSGYDPGGRFYVLRSKGWVERTKVIVVVRNKEVVEVGQAGTLRPAVNDVLLVPCDFSEDGHLPRLKAGAPAGSFATTDGGSYDCSRFPEKGVLIRRRREVYMGPGAFSDYSTIAEAAEAL